MHASNHPSIHAVWLQVADGSMQCVSAVPNLRALVLGHTRVQDTGLAMLAASSALTHVTFTAEAITNAGLLVSRVWCDCPHPTESDGMCCVNE